MSKLHVVVSMTTFAIVGCLQPVDEPDVVLDVLNCGTNPPITCYPDNDGDGQGAGVGISVCTCAAGTVSNNSDCNDDDASVKRRSCYTDADSDGHGAADSSPIGVCAASCASRGLSDDHVDWDDTDAGSTLRTCYDDADGDGFAGTVIYVEATTCAGYSDTKTDDDDTDATCYQYLDCYPDGDGDHYGHGASTRFCTGSTCPAGWSESAGDCDDTNRNIHPYRLEVAGNGVDDDCSGATDEARSVFYEAGNANTDTSFAIAVTLNSTAEITAATTTGLKAQISYRKLQDTNGESDTTWLVTGTKTMTVSTSGGVTTATVTLTGLDSLTVYEARLSLFASDGTRIQAVGCSTCFNNDPYYTMTKPSGSSTPVKTARYNIVVEALYQYYYFRTHSMGSWDHSLRNHFDLEDDASEWCSEFYATSTKPYLVDMNPCRYSSSQSWCDPAETGTPESSTHAMFDYFDGYSNAVTGATEADVAASKAGDWLGIKPTDTYVYGQHTQMLLAYNATAHIYWFVEGNGSDNGTCGNRVHTVNVGSHAVDEAHQWVWSIGHLDNPSMIDP